jgi:hypothetical protein
MNLKSHLNKPLLFIIALAFFLNFYGNDWGLPYRWNVDEDVALSLRIIADKNIVIHDDHHPPFYRYVLAAYMLPYLGALKMRNFDFTGLAESASVSWIKVAEDYPDFAKSAYIWARSLSALLGAAAVFMVFLLGQEAGGRGVGIISALILSVTHGFAAENHFAKTTALVNLLGLLVVYLSAIALRPGRKPRYCFIAAAFFAGMAVSTKFNGIILVVPLITAGVFKAGERRVAELIWAGFVFLSGILISWPTLIFQNSLDVSRSYYRDFFYKEHMVSFGIGILNYLIQIVFMFGLPLAIAAFCGVFSALRRAFSSKEIKPVELIMFTLISANLILSATFQLDFAYSKFIVLIIPFLSVFGGKFLYALLQHGGAHHRIKVFAFAAIFIYSLLLTFKLDLIFAKEDLRYQVSEWIENNIKHGESIEHHQQYSWLYSPRIIKNCEVIYFGRSSREYPYTLYALSAERDEYLRGLLEKGSRADYFLIFTEYVDFLDKFSRDSGTFKDRIRYRMLRDKFFGFRQRISFTAVNYKVRSKLIKGLSYPKNLFWDPFYDGYYPAQIIVYKRIK